MPVLRERRAIPEEPDLRGTKDIKVALAVLGHKGIRETSVALARKVIKEMLAALGHKGIRDIKEQREGLGHRVTKGIREMPETTARRVTKDIKEQRALDILPRLAHHCW
jgi:hypothetical protein